MGQVSSHFYHSLCEPHAEEWQVFHCVYQSSKLSKSRELRQTEVSVVAANNNWSKFVDIKSRSLKGQDLLQLHFVFQKEGNTRFTCRDHSLHFQSIQLLGMKREVSEQAEFCNHAGDTEIPLLCFVKYLDTRLNHSKLETKPIPYIYTPPFPQEIQNGIHEFSTPLFPHEHWLLPH